MIPAPPSAPRRAGPRERLARAAAPSRLWIDFVNTDASAQAPRGDLVRDIDTLLRWLVDHDGLDHERAQGIGRRAVLAPAAAAAAVVEARRVRAALRTLAERGGATTSGAAKVRSEAVTEINRVLGRSAGTRRIEAQGTHFIRVFVPTGDAFAGLMIPVVESAADSLMAGELPRVRRCADPRCHRVFHDATRNGQRRWCDMGTCGNRAKAARHRAKRRHAPLALVRPGDGP